MIDIRQLMGKVDSVAVDPAILTGDPVIDNTQALLISIKAGGLASVDTNGYVALADGATENAIGVFANDGVSNPLDNSPVDCVVCADVKLLARSKVTPLAES